jgi:hypothetical protein
MHEKIKLLIETFLDDLQDILEDDPEVCVEILNESMKDLSQIFPLFLDRIFNASAEIEDLEKRVDSYSYLSNYCAYQEDIVTKKEVSIKKRKI